MKTIRIALTVAATLNLYSFSSHADEIKYVKIETIQTCGRAWIDLDGLLKTKNQLVFKDFKAPSPLPVPLSMLYSVSDLDGQEVDPTNTLWALNKHFYSTDENGIARLNAEAARKGIHIEITYVSGQRTPIAGAHYFSPLMTHPIQMIDFKIIPAATCTEIEH